MGSIATFKATYLTVSPPVLPPGQRAQLAGAVYAIDDLVARGLSYPAAQAAVASSQRALRIVHRAQRFSSPYQATLLPDFWGISAP